MPTKNIAPLSIKRHGLVVKSNYLKFYYVVFASKSY